MAATTVSPAKSQPLKAVGSNKAQSGTAEWVAILKQAAADWSEDKASRLAAALALYTILSLAPLIVISIKIAGLILKDKAAGQVQDQLTQLMGSDSAGVIQDMIKAGMKPGGGIFASVISLVILFFSATGVFGELQDAMNTIWEVKPKPNQGVWGFVRTRLLSLSMVFGIAFLLLTSMFVSALMTGLAHSIAGDMKWLAFVIDVVVSVGVVTLLFAMIFKFLPDAKVEWRDVWLGAFFTAAAFTFGKYGLAIYFKYASPVSAFGAAGSLAAVLLWIYYSSMILFFGAEFTQAHATYEGRSIAPSSHAVKVTTEERAQEGIVSDERLSKAVEKQERPAASAKRPAPPPPRGTPARRPGDRRTAKDAAFAAGGLALGAVLGGLGVEYLLHDPKKPTARHAAAVKLNQRLDTVERKLGSVSRIQEYLKNVDVKDRITQVEKEIRRAGTPVRAKETGRPTWMVRLGDVIGGRWSNL